MSARQGAPSVTGISPHQGTPGTQITLRGENLGESQSDLVALVICGTDCLVSAKWKSSTKVIARLGAAKRGLGDVVVVTRSGGRGVSNVQFRVLIEQVGPLQESSVWVDESRTVPGRTTMRNVLEVAETEDMLGLKVDNQRQLDPTLLAKMFPEGSGNCRMENFIPAWYLLENHKHTSMADLRQGLKNLQKSITQEEESSKSVHKANLNSLINCVETLTELHGKVEPKVRKDKRPSCPLTGGLSKKISDSKTTADRLFKEVLSRKDRADATRNALSVLTRFRFIFFLPESIDENMAKGDYSTILNDYTRAKALYKDSEVGLFRELMAVLDEKMNGLKHALRRRLMDTPSSFEEQSKLIKYLKVLDPDSDPSWDCITSYHCWLEENFWQVQAKYHRLAVEEEKHDPSSPPPPHLVEHRHNYKQALVTDLLAVLTDKLQSFWKLAQSYSNSEDERYREKQDDIDQMVLSTTNVASWLLLNALVPTSLPESVQSQYRDQFVVWPVVSADFQVTDLFSSLKTLRSSVKQLLVESQFSRMHVQPLVELSTTIRLKCLGLVVEKCSDSVMAIGQRENWKMDVVGGQSKTQLPDLFETELNEILPSVKQILSFHNFPGEVDLFSRDRVRQMIVELLIMALLSFKDCYDQLLQLKPPATSSSEMPPPPLTRPSHLTSSSAFNHGDAMGPNNSAIGDRKRGSVGGGAAVGNGEIGPRKLLISITNVQYVINHSLSAIVRRLAENGVKFHDLIFKKCKQKFIHYRQQLIRHYIAMKLATVTSLLDSIDYAHVPEEEDASEFAKELIMCTVFVQSELHLLAPHLIHQVLTTVVESIVLESAKSIQMKVAERRADRESTTQALIDLTTLEEAFKYFLPSAAKGALHSACAKFKDNIDHESFEASMQSVRSGLRMAFESLQSGNDVTEEDAEESRDKVADV